MVNAAGRTQTAGRAQNQRADARRNRAAILDAAIRCLGRNPEASVGEIAREAGVGRVTLYGHFSARTELVDAAFAHAIDEGERALSAVDLQGDAEQALVRLIGTSWTLVDRFRSLLLAAQGVLPPGRIRSLHARPMERMHGLVTRGQRDGVFRTDLPASWLVGTIHSVMHGATEEINEGRIDPDEAPRFISATVIAALAATSVRPLPAPDGETQ